MLIRNSVALLATLALSLTSVAHAQHISAVDNTAAHLAARPTPVSLGVGEEFGGMIGYFRSEGSSDVELATDSDVLGGITFHFADATNCMSSGDGYDDVAVMYIDSRAGGITSTMALADTSGAGSTAVSGASRGGTPDTNAAQLNFPSGFDADYAIAFHNSCGRTSWAALFDISAGTVAPVRALTLTQTGGAPWDDFSLTGLTVNDLGINSGDSFDYVVTLLNTYDGYRGNEFHGIATPPAEGTGLPNYTLPSFNRFTTVGPILINELDSDSLSPPTTDNLEFIELIGPAGCDLSGTHLAFYNGGSTGDPLYRTLDLDTQSIRGSGFFVLGNSAVSPAPDLTFSNGGLQNGADAVAFILEDTVRVSGSSPDTTNLIDAVVYDTNDADDTALLAALGLSGQPQLNEDGRTRGGDSTIDSLNRCPPSTGRLNTAGWVPNPPSPGSANDCSVCGDGRVEGPEQCDVSFSISIGGDGPIERDCCTSFCRFEGAGTLCRGAVDDCDAEEVCGGSSGDCPTDALMPSTHMCDPPDDLCDATEFCTGSSVACPGDSLLPNTAVCRTAAGPCDAEERCTGASIVCPFDGLAGSSAVCRPAAGDCDAPEVCDGLRVQCPRDDFSPAATVCRTAAGDCDAAETCDGTSVDCPADAFLAMGAECRAVADDCDAAELCGGASADCPVDAFADMTTVCRVSAGACDVDDLCTGTDPACPVDAFAADGTSCADSLRCNGTETCSAGACGAGTPRDCDDRNVCTADSCAEPGGCENTPVAGCCNIDSDCDDGNSCTSDTCSGTGGSCTASPITDCCATDADCDDGNSCTTDACDTTTNRCDRTPVAGCCTTDADCDDSNACTADTCDASTGMCGNADIAGCCVTDGDCNDMNTCTADSCDASSMTCTNDGIAGCCLVDDDCDDMDECTTDMCDSVTATCSSDRIPGCGRDAGGVGDDGGAGSDDAGADAGFDAGPRDGAVGTGGDGSVGDAGMGETEGGCGCRTTGGPSRTPWALLLGLGAVVFWRRRR